MSRRARPPGTRPRARSRRPARAGTGRETRATAGRSSSYAACRASLEGSQRVFDHAQGSSDPLAVLGRVQPARCARWMWEGDRGRTAEVVTPADRIGETRHAEEPSRRESADRHDQLRLEEPQLRVTPALAEPLLLRRRRAVAASRACASGVAPRHRGAVERRVELVLVELEPAAQRLARTASPRAAFLALDDAG